MLPQSTLAASVLLSHRLTFSCARAQVYKTQVANGGTLPRLFIAGQGELDWLVKDYQQELGNAVIYLGLAQHEKVACILREADVYVSAAQNETYGRALVEARRCGLPVVTFESCNIHVCDATGRPYAECTPWPNFLYILHPAFLFLPAFHHVRAGTPWP